MATRRGLFANLLWSPGWLCWWTLTASLLEVLETAPGCHHQIPHSRVLVEYSVSIRTVEYCVATKNLSKNAEDPLKVKQNKNECILPLDRRTKQVSPGSPGGKERGFHMLGRDSFMLVC